MFKKTLAVAVPIVAVAALAMMAGTGFARTHVTHHTVVAPCPSGNGTCVYVCPPDTNLRLCVAYKCPAGTTNLQYCTRITLVPSDIQLASRAAVVSSSRSTDVALACFGKPTCKGRLTLSYGGVVIAHEPYDISGNNVGVVHITLSQSGYQDLTATGRLVVSATAVDLAGSSAHGKIALFAA
jgi:hypothetical protein